MMLFRPAAHQLLHLIIPGAVSKVAYPDRWLKAWLMMMLATVIDLDHLLAIPIYDPNRCSIGFHPLHELWFIALYVILCFIPKARIIGIGLVVHMALDAIDCQLTNGVWIH